MAKTIKQWQVDIHAFNVECGWWEVPKGIVAAIDLEQSTEHKSIDAIIDEVRSWVRLKLIMEKLALVGTEISEAIEELRNHHVESEVYFPSSLGRVGIDDEQAKAAHHKPEGYGVELADAVIRIFDLAEFSGIDLDAMMEMKMAYNATRGHRYGGDTGKPKLA